MDNTKKPLRILFVADVSIERVIGGAERVLFEQASRLSRVGNQVVVLTRKPSPGAADRIMIQGIEEWRYNVERRNDMTFLFTSIKNTRRVFNSIFRKFRFTCINFHQPISAAGVITSPLCRNVKKIYTCHSFSHEEYLSRNDKPQGIVPAVIYRFNIYLRKWLEKAVLKRSERVIVLSDFTRKKLVNRHRIPTQKISTVHGGVDLNTFQPADNKQYIIRRQLGIPEDKLILLTVRNLVQRMGLENLIQGLRKIIREAPDTYLVIGGEGPLKGKLMKLAQQVGVSDSICFTGFIPEKDLPDYYRMADMFILPTRELEGFGLVTIEAMASGLPVLGTPIGGIQEVLKAFDKSFLFEDTGPEAIADLILRKSRQIKEHPGQWNDIKKGCRTFVEKYYSWDRHIDALEKIMIGN